MENSRRPYDRSLSKEPGPKKPRLTEVPTAPDRSFNGRSGFIQRPATSNSGGGGLSFQRDRGSESSNTVRGPFPYQPGQQLHQELVTQYQTALAELTFNSKPIITNLTIIAGENLHAAKAITDIVCANILEVPSEQKLPSLYLLDSIVKNIGRDYIKSFASRLPEVFCEAYRQVEPSIHQGMRHLFGTWKGVFPPQSLKMIEKELGFTTTVNGSSPGTITSKPDSQSQRPAHSIHVNPKYLEARKHLQTTRARGAGSDISGALVNSIEDVESLERTSSVNSVRSWADTYAKHQHRDLVNEPVGDRNSSVPHVDPEYGSNVSERSGLGTGRVIETSKEQGFDRPWYESGCDVSGKISNENNDFDRNAAYKSAISNSHLQHKKNFISRSTNGMSRSWKNSEEEEYIWDEMNSRPTDHSTAETLAQDHRTPENYERLNIASHLRRPQGIHDIGPRVDDKASADSISTELVRVASGTQMPSSWSQELHPPEGRTLSGPGKNISGYPVGYTTGLESSASIVAREPFQPQPGPSHIGAPSYGPKVSMTQKRQTLGAGSSTTQSFMHQRPPSPSFSANSNPLLRNVSERNQTSIGPPTDPRKPPGLRNIGSHDQLSRDSLPLPSRDVYQASTQRSQPQNLRTTSAVIPPLHQRKHVPSTQQKNLEVSEFDSSGGQNFFQPHISGSENRSSMVNSSSDKSNPRTDEFPGSGQSITSSLLAAVVQSGILDRSSLKGSLTKPSFQETGLGSSLGDVQPPLSSGPPAIFSSSQPLHGNTLLPAFSLKKVELQPLSPGPPPSSLACIHPEKMLSAVSSTSNPVSSLLSSLVAKGLISSSKSDSLSSSSLKISDQSLDSSPGVASTSSTPVSSVPDIMAKPLLSITDGSSSFKSAAKGSDDLPWSTTKIKNLIGFEFRPDVVRNLHPDVVRDLSDLPHQCSLCGLKLKIQEQLDRHMEWHGLRDPEQDPCKKISRRWYADSVDWVAGIGHFHPIDGDTDLLGGLGEASENSEQMVPADESQCACILCGELFEDFYSQERDEWMFKGAVYLPIPSSDSHERTGTTNTNACSSPIVHANCVSEDSVHDLGLACNINLENDA